jgi:hypothetical protein
MQRVDRPPINPDIWSVAVGLQETFSAIVASLAQALKLPKEELVYVATMRLDMVGDCRRHDLTATLQAEFAQRMFAELMLA